MCKKLLVVLACWVALSIPALAATEAEPVQVRGRFQLSIPALLQLKLVGAKDIRFLLSELDVLSGTPVEQSAGTLVINSNRAGTTLRASCSGWVAQHPGSRADFKLEIMARSDQTAAGFTELATGSTGTDSISLVHWDGGVINGQVPLTLRISGVDMHDDPDSYTATITYTISD
jgi:hypothetical protein